MYYINGTPLNDVIKQALCINHTILEEDGEVSTNKGTIGFIFDEDALGETVKNIMPNEETGLEYTPSLFEYTRSLMSVHFEADEKGFCLATRDDDVRRYLDDNHDHMFSDSDTVDGDVFYTIYFDGSPIDMLGELGISKDKALLYERVYQKSPDGPTKCLEKGTKEVPDYTISEDKVEIHHPESFMLVNDNSVQFLKPDPKLLPQLDM